MLTEKTGVSVRGATSAGFIAGISGVLGMILVGCSGMPASAPAQSDSAPYVVPESSTGHTVTTSTTVVEGPEAGDGGEDMAMATETRDDYSALTCYEWARVPEINTAPGDETADGGMHETLVVLRHATVEEVKMPARYEWVDGPAVIRPACRRGEAGACPGSEAQVPAEVRVVRQKAMVQPERTERVVVPAVVKHALLERLPGEQTQFCGDSCSGLSLWESGDAMQPPRQDRGYYFERRVVPCETYR